MVLPERSSRSVPYQTLRVFTSKPTCYFSKPSCCIAVSKGKKAYCWNYCRPPKSFMYFHPHVPFSYLIIPKTSASHRDFRPTNATINPLRQINTMSTRFVNKRRPASPLAVPTAQIAATASTVLAIDNSTTPKDPPESKAKPLAALAPSQSPSQRAPTKASTRAPTSTASKPCTPNAA